MIHGRDPLLEDAEFLAVLEGAHRAVGFRSGITHTERMLTEKGPKIIEINGEMIPCLQPPAACSGYWLLVQHKAAICFFHPRQALGGFLDVVIDGGVLLAVHLGVKKSSARGWPPTRSMAAASARRGCSASTSSACSSARADSRR
ncbi:hypothetical protein [Chromobacterium subtsugae]|uniref:hypothetical protein n=1 Tax=Chromobacterium subtsugae TaxID=251747 RepID=UPI000641380E|nr:hypothetical protein [Chromobacterium subtsugae]